MRKGTAAQEMTLSEDLRSYDSVAERVVMDTAGNVLQITRNRRSRASDEMSRYRKLCRHNE